MHDIQTTPPNVDTSALTKAISTAFAKKPEDPDLEAVAALHGVPVAAVEQHIDTHSAEIDRQVVEIREAGGDVALRALDALRDVLTQIGEGVASSSLPFGSLIKAGEFLNKVSGMEARQRVQAAPKETDRVVLQIIIGDRQVDLVANGQPSADVIDVEPVDPLAGLRGALNAGGADD